MIRVRAPRLAPAASACVVAMALALAAHAALPAEQWKHGPREALAAADVSAKFDYGFYDRVQQWIAETGAAGAAGASGASDVPATRNVMIMVDRLSTGGRDPDAVAGENKDTVVRALGGLGATNIVRAESLSFVTATVPLARLAELAEYGSVHRIGDGEELLRKSVGTARSTIATESRDRTLPGGTVLTGRGVNVAILDDGIDSPALNPRVGKTQHCADMSGCRVQTMSDRVPDKTKTDALHGTRVAGVLAASSGTFGTDTFPEGIATGVTLFDVIVEGTSTNNEGAFFTSMANALDWAYTNGAHIANLSYESPECNAQGVGALIVDEAVDKGMVVVGAAGPSGAAGGQGAPNSEPALEVLVGGTPAGPVVDLAASPGRASVSLRAADAEGDAVSFSMDVLETTMAGGVAAASPPALADHGNGTATLTVDGSAAGEYLVALSAADAHGEEWGTYLIRVAPAAGSP